MDSYLEIKEKTRIWIKKLKRPRMSLSKSLRSLNFHDNKIKESKQHVVIDSLGFSFEQELAIIKSFLDYDFYRSTYVDIKNSNIDPALHYCTYGWREGRDPRSDFSTRDYLSQLNNKNINPFLHYILKGKKENMSLRNTEKKETVHINIISQKRIGDVTEKKVALLVSYSPNGEFLPYVEILAKSLMQQKINVVLIVNTEKNLEKLRPIDARLECLFGVYFRENKGFDFAAWAQVIQIEPQILNCDELLFINDSIGGPIRQELLESCLKKMRSSPFDIVALTQNMMPKWHLQSYFFLFKKTALESWSFLKYIRSIKVLNTIQEVINEYEIKFAETMRDSGLRCGAIFENNTGTDQTTFHWRELIEDGFPFIKMKVIRNESLDIDNKRWRQFLIEQGFNIPPNFEHSRSVSVKEIINDNLSVDSEKLRVSFIGPWNYSVGLGIASAGYLSALMHTKFELNIYPVETPFHIHARSAPTWTMCSFSGLSDVSLVHLNPDSMRVISTKQKECIQRSRFTVGLWVWEMSHFPENWRFALQDVDAIWAPSSYCAETFSKACSLPIAVVPHVITLPLLDNVNYYKKKIKELYNLPIQSKIVLYIFDGSSFMDRKNPWALIKSFLESELSARGWYLVLKSKNLTSHQHESKQLKEIIKNHSNIILIEKRLPKKILKMLFLSCDIYASPHASEGFGLTVAEAMAASKLVVATDFGGTRDFLTNETGYPVKYKMITLEKTVGPYEKSGQWAEIDICDLKNNLIKAADDHESEVLAKAFHAREFIRQKYSSEYVAECIKKNIINMMRNKEQW